MKSVAAKIAEENGLSLVLLFGSQARGRTNRDSDFDFGVLGKNRLMPREIAELSFLLAHTMGIRDTYVEVVDLRSAPPLLLKEVSTDAVLLYEQEPALFAKFKIYGLKRYFEAKPLFELRRRSLNTFLETI